LLLQDDGKKPRKKFYEPFGNKSYYQGPEVSTRLQVGEYTLVYWDPQGRKGDYVAIVGKREIWKGNDILRASIVTPIIRRGEELHLQQTKTSDKEREKRTLNKVAKVAADGERSRSLLKIMVDFKAAKEKERWRIVNDGVMGGLSQSGIEITSATHAVFQGTLSLENNGGFASVRRLPHDYKLAKHEGVLLRIKGDGRTYQFRVRTNDRFDGVSYRAEFKTKRGKWMTVKVPFKSMKPTFRGRPVPDAPPLRPERIRQIGFLIGDKREGRFRIEIDWIQAYRPRAKSKPSED
jgi:monofunctional biosynthetic peptidoglycan transglycosylase